MNLLNRQAQLAVPSSGPGPEHTNRKGSVGGQQTVTGGLLVRHLLVRLWVAATGALQQTLKGSSVSGLLVRLEASGVGIEGHDRTSLGRQRKIT
jgi:hypothetical protein